MTDLVLNLNCSEHAIYSRILSGCVYIIKYGLTSPDLFLRRVHKRQAKRLRKRGVNMNVSGFEYAAAENILTDLKVLPTPLIPAGLYSSLRQLLDIYGNESRRKLISEAFKETDPVNVYVLQALLKTMSLLGNFESGWNCPCGKFVEGNGLSWTMVALPITSYILREKCASSGHWFVSWGQMASDVEVVKILITHWQDIRTLTPSNLPIIKPSSSTIVKMWHCNLSHRSHVTTEPNEIPIFEVENMMTPVSFKPAKTGDFDITLYEDPGKGSDECELEELNLNATLQSLDQFYMDNMESLQTVKDRLDLECISLKSDQYTDDSEFADDDTWKKVGLNRENVWSNIDSEEEGEGEGTKEQITDLVSNILSGCGAGQYEMWADFTPPPPNTVVSKQVSKSYWSDHSQSTRRELLVAKIREAVRQTFREVREKLSSEAESESVENTVTEPSHLTIQCPKIVAPPVATSTSPTRSRIMELLVKANPITDISKLERLADRLFPAKTPDSTSTRSKKHGLTRKEAKGNQKSSNPFDIPPHLIKEFVPKAKELLSENANLTMEQDLKPIELSRGTFMAVPSYPSVYQEYAGEQFYMNVEELGLNYLSSGYYQDAPCTNFQTDQTILPTDTLSFQTDQVINYPADAAASLTYPVLVESGLTGNSRAVRSHVPLIPVPPIPEELQSTTPPNLPTIMMLSQLFTPI